jgi:3-hydroxybutyryl-CoA dehydrogenase
MSAPAVVGVVGAGTMGAGIAQLACAGGMETRLHDPVPDALERGQASVVRGLTKLAEKGRLEDPEAARGRLQAVSDIEGLAGCELVIEAAPERAELKRHLFARLSGICGASAVLATNTSSIPVTSLAGAATRPDRVVGMHFFNPPPLMRLLEVIPAEQTGDHALELAKAAGEAMGKHVIVAADGPGFLVNRCGRPFSMESLRLVSEGVATPQQVDRICRMAGGFRMGPFELMDLVGVDVGFEVAKSFTELSFGEPRWRPSPLQARMVAAGRLGRKTGSGWYSYDDGPHRAEDPQPLATRAVENLPAAAAAAGIELVSCAAASLGVQRRPRAVGYLLLPPTGGLVELTRSPSTPERACRRVEQLCADAGLHHEWVEDSPGLVLGRIVCQLVNEALFAVGEGVGSPGDVDSGTTLGLNHPRGPVAWGRAIGFDRVLGTIDALWEELREERYRAAPMLRRAAREGDLPPASQA